MYFASIIFELAGYKGILFQLPNKKPQNIRSVCITIDDVPKDCFYFSKLLSVFEKFGVVVSFMVISSFVSPESEELLLQAVKNGHHLCNHGSFDRMHARLKYEDLNLEIVHCQRLIDSIYQKAGVPNPVIKYYRPGCGLISNTIYQYCKDHNYKIVLGSNYPSDPNIPIGALHQFYVWCHLRPHDIIILHERKWTVDSIDDIVRDIIKEGYVLTTLDKWGY